MKKKLLMRMGQQKTMDNGNPNVYKTIKQIYELTYFVNVPYSHHYINHKSYVNHKIVFYGCSQREIHYRLFCNQCECMHFCVILFPFNMNM